MRGSRVACVRLLFAAVLVVFSIAGAYCDAPPGRDALTDGAAVQWGAEADGADAAVFDDAEILVAGASSLRLDTTAPFDCWLWAPVERDADWDFSEVSAISMRVLAANEHTFQNNSPWIRLYSSPDDYFEFQAPREVLNDALGSWLTIRISLDGSSEWEKRVVGDPDIAHISCFEFHADTWDSGFTLWLDDLNLGTPSAGPGGWQMMQRDACKTGRADFSIPDSRENNQLFESILWQTPSPGSPGEGGFGGTQMVFRDYPDETGIVAGTYHWPKGVQGMDRTTGRLLWYGNPQGGETIGDIVPAFSNDGNTIYVVNDATDSEFYPEGHALMAFEAREGPGNFWHTGGSWDPSALQILSPTIAPDGRIFLHKWIGAPYAGCDYGYLIDLCWGGEIGANAGYSDPALYEDDEMLRVVIGGRHGEIYSFHGESGALLWSKNLAGAGLLDASVTIDPSNGNIYVGVGDQDICVAGLDKEGNGLWSSSGFEQVFDHQEGVNNPQRAQSAGCLSWDGQTYYFQTSSEAGDGALYAINTSDGSTKWTYQTGSKGWEMSSSRPIVTRDGIIVVGNNYGGTYYALRDDGFEVVLLDSLEMDGGPARASASISSDGILYLPVRIPWTMPFQDGGSPSFQTENVFTAFSLLEGGSAVLPPPAELKATPLDSAVRLDWQPLEPSEQFAHYAIYRAQEPFSNVDGREPIATTDNIASASYLDETAENGEWYYYAVTSVSTSGGEMSQVRCVGPVSPFSESDIQVVSVSRLPRYPRYDPTYTHYEITEPSGFGPYIFTAATGLGGGQTLEDKRWPDVGEAVTYMARIRNRGTEPVDQDVGIQWIVDGVHEPLQWVYMDLQPGEQAEVSFVLNWDGQPHDLTLDVLYYDARSSNNTFELNTLGVPFLSYVDSSFAHAFRAESLGMAYAATDDIFDWLNLHMRRFNDMFAEQGSGKRVHFDVLEMIPDSSPDPGTDRQPFAIFPFRYRAGEPTYRTSGYYHPDEDLDYGLLHEMAHQLGLIDIYQLDVPAEANLVSGQPYSAVACLMHGCSPFLSEHSALAMHSWLNAAHGYYGQYLYKLPQTMRVRLLGADGNPLKGASVKMYQYCERPAFGGKVITNQVKAQGTTDANGCWTLPNVPVDQNKVPPVPTGDMLTDNPFGYVAVVDTNGVLHFEVEYEGAVDFCWLDITEANVAYWQGQTLVATFDRRLALGGPVQAVPPDDMAELNACDWVAWAEGSDPSGTYAEDDTGRVVAGQGSIHFVTNGGFDTSLRYPGTVQARWDVRQAEYLALWVWPENMNWFQNNSPWIRLVDSRGNYAEYRYYVNGQPFDVFNANRGQWADLKIPLNPDPDLFVDGWHREDHGTPDFSSIRFVDIHADTWDYGFELWVDNVRFLWPARSVHEARMAPNGSGAELKSIPVTGVFPGVFYVENEDRCCGIRVESSNGDIAVGDLVDVAGETGTNSEGERVIIADQVQVLPGSTLLRPLHMAGKSLGGGDTPGLDPLTGAGQKGVAGGAGLNNIGLLVRLSGRVCCVNDAAGQFRLDDGSTGGGVLVQLPAGTATPLDGSFASVTGVSSCYAEGDDLRPLLLVREEVDLVWPAALP